jgi:hypothetical protein
LGNESDEGLGEENRSNFLELKIHGQNVMPFDEADQLLFMVHHREMDQVTGDQGVQNLH